jgi:rod shape-determining protein MreD
MRPLSHYLLSILPVVLAVLLVLLSAVPLGAGGWSLTPNVAWLMTLVMVALCPYAWGRVLAFALGLLQDMVFGTPLGSQALLALLLAQLVAMQAERQQVQLFRLRWLEAAGLLLLWHLMLWAIMQLVNTDAPTLPHLLVAGLVNALWYPLFYWLAARLCAVLPD